MRDDITQNPRWASLPQSVKFYLKYHRNNLSHHHYSWKYDAGDFLKKTFLEIALNFEPLMYAVVAFAAYHNALSREDGRVKDFLDAYNKSVSLLRQSLAKTDRHSLSTLLTILQLATIEVRIDDTFYYLCTIEVRIDDDSFYYLCTDDLLQGILG
jgi:hypothetical protein